ncbi:two-component regulator propeller domain-containing protein [Fodinibius sp. Rm-B-1B1-1]|uniref:two-component regulator propeller domain-containing protein n=1 Tax=Fodinibius alkaliphilus TaxID=3140241 RepID=UPI00315A8770
MTLVLAPIKKIISFAYHSIGIIIFLIFSLPAIHSTVGMVCFATPQPENIGLSFIKSDYILDQWTVKDGLPVNTTTKIVKGEEGYLWIGTTDGLVRFDGVDFKVFKTVEYPSMTSNRIVDLKKTYDGTIWLGTDKGELIKFTGSEFERVSSKDGLNGDQYSSLYIDPSGRMWVGTKKGISVYKDGNMSPFYPQKIRGHILRIYKGFENDIWYVDKKNKSVNLFDGNKSTLVYRKKQHTGIIPFLTLNTGNLLFAADKSIYRFSNYNLTKLNFPDYKITDLFQRDDGTIVAATRDNGLYELKNGDWIHTNEGIGWRMGGEVLKRHAGSMMYITRNRVYKDNSLLVKFKSRITGYYFDRENNLWFTTNRSGFYRLKSNPFTIYGLKEGIPTSNINSIAQVTDGSIWIGTFGAGPVRLKNNKIITSFDFQSLNPGDTPQKKYVLSMLQRENGILLVSILNHGIYQFDEEKKLFSQVNVPFLKDREENGLNVTALFEDSKNRLWVGTTEDGLWMKKDEVWNQVNINDGINYPVRYITEAPDGSLWMGTNGEGIIHYDKGNIDVYDKDDGLSSNLIRSIYIDTKESPSNYTLYFGSEDLGLNRLTIKKGIPQWQNNTIFAKDNGLYSNGIHQIIEDGQERLWMSSNQGIFYVLKSELDKYSKGELLKINSVGYNETDGLRSREFNGGVQQSGIKAQDGSLWFSSQGGVVTFDPSSFPRDSFFPRAIIKGVISEDESIRIENDSLTLNANQRNFEIDFTGFSYRDPESIRFKYRLKGFDNDWTIGTNRTAYYTNIPPGDYTFEVIASTNNKNWSQNPASLAITVFPYFYETTIFYVIVAIVLFIGLAGLIQLRTYRLKQRENKLEQAVRKRSQQLMKEKIKTEKQAQELRRLNERKNQFFTNITHELRTPLTMLIGPLKILHENEDIQMQAVRDQLEPMIRNGERLQRLIDQLLELSRIEAGMVELQASRQSVTSFVDELVLEFSPMAEVKNICLTTDLPDRDCMVYFDNQKIQKALSNLLSNALKFTPQNGRVSVKVVENNTEVTIKVSDTGIGIDEEELNHVFDRFYQVDSTSTRKNEGTGVGLAFAKELVHLHKGTLTVESTLGEGSTFSLSLLKGKTHLREEQITEDVEAIPDEIGAPAVFNVRQTADNGERKTTAEEDKTTLLVIDDNPDIRDYIRTIMVPDYTILEASDGKQGLAAVRKQLPDLVICDVMMPEMDGFELSRALKEDPMTKGIPLIFVTAMADKQGELKGLKAGADSYITKPFDADVLRARIGNLLEQRSRLQQVFTDEEFTVSTASEPSPFEQQVREVIETHLTDSDFTVLQLAEEMAVDRSHLSRKLKAEAGVTPAKLIRDLRLERATVLLRKGEDNISEIAYSIGFNSLSYFSRRFKEKYDVTPSAYLDKVM